MAPGMKITATTSVGTIAVTAVDELTRSYTWDGATRAIEMQPQKSRYFGSLGLFFEGADVHWREHHGIALLDGRGPAGLQDGGRGDEMDQGTRTHEAGLPRRRADGRVV